MSDLLDRLRQLRKLLLDPQMQACLAEQVDCYDPDGDNGIDAELRQVVASDDKGGTFNGLLCELAQRAVEEQERDEQRAADRKDRGEA